MQKTRFDSNFKSLHLADELYCEVLKLKLPYYLKDQIRRSSSSVVLNLVEGNAQRTKRAKRRFYQIAYASAKETQGVLILANSKVGLHKQADKLGAYLYKLIESLS
ncbi:MAG: four helix bundle protein [Bacteriovoracaceae bacterium]|jgi:four helix bundle protein|nr:four helix bundle protein [Bacteriovoracaceae bacterium]